MRLKVKIFIVSSVFFFKYIDEKVRRTQRDPDQHIITKMSKDKDKEIILKATKEKQIVRYLGIPIRLSADFSAETHCCFPRYVVYPGGR